MLQSVVLKQASVQTWHTKQNDTHKRIPGTTVNIEIFPTLETIVEGSTYYKETAHHTPTSGT